RRHHRRAERSERGRQPFSKVCMEDRHKDCQVREVSHRRTAMSAVGYHHCRWWELIRDNRESQYSWLMERSWTNTLKTSNGPELPEVADKDDVAHLLTEGEGELRSVC